MLIQIKKLKKRYAGDEKADRLADFLANATAEMIVGFFEEDREPDGTPVSAVAYKQEFGGIGSGYGEETKAPKNRPYEGFTVKFGVIPPRPFMRPAIAKNENKWIRALKKEIKETLDNLGQSKLDIETPLERLGVIVEGDIQRGIKAVREPALAPITLKLRRNRGNRSTKPLIDSGTMLKSVKHKIRRGK